jgi:hypothetical protein
VFRANVGLEFSKELSQRPRHGRHEIPATRERKYGAYDPETLRSQMAFVAALCGRPLSPIGESHRLFDADKQNGSPPDPRTIRKLASQIVGQVITPEAADYDAARSIFNRAFDRHPTVILRSGSPSNVERALGFAQAQHLPLAVRAGGHSDDSHSGAGIRSTA